MQHYGKRRKCWLPAFSPFPTTFSKSFFLWVINCWDCVVKNKRFPVVPLTSTLCNIFHRQLADFQYSLAETINLLDIAQSRVERDLDYAKLQGQGGRLVLKVRG